MKRLHSLLLICTGLLVGLLGGAMITAVYSQQAKYDYNQVIARAGDTLVTRGQLAEALIGKVGGKALDADLRETATVAEMARRANVVITQDEMEKRLQECYKTYDLLNSRKQIDSVPVPVLQETLRKSLLAEKIVNCSVSQGEAETYFQKNRSQFYRPALYKLIMMSTDNEADAAAIIKRLRQGEDPRKLAKIYNIFDQMKAVEGDVGWNARSSMSPDAAEAVFDANDGKGLRVKEFTQSPVVYKFKTEQGEEKSQYLVFYAVDYQADSAPSFDEVRTAAYFLARSAKTTQLFSEYFKNHSREIQWVRIKDLTDSQAQANTPQPGTAPAATPADQPK